MYMWLRILLINANPYVLSMKPIKEIKIWYHFMNFGPLQLHTKMHFAYGAIGKLETIKMNINIHLKQMGPAIKHYIFPLQ